MARILHFLFNDKFGIGEFFGVMTGVFLASHPHSWLPILTLGLLLIFFSALIKTYLADKR